MMFIIIIIVIVTIIIIIIIIIHNDGKRPSVSIPLPSGHVVFIQSRINVFATSWHLNNAALTSMLRIGVHTTKH